MQTLQLTLALLIMTELVTMQAQSYDWISESYPGSYFIDVSEKDHEIIAALSAGAVQVYDPDLFYKTIYYKINISQIEEQYIISPEEIATYDSSPRYSTLSTKYIPETDRWLMIQSAHKEGYNFSHRAILFSSEFELLDSTSFDTIGITMECQIGNSFNNKTQVIGTILPPDVKILYLEYDHNRPNSVGKIVISQSTPKKMSWITSMEIDERTGNMLIFYYNGIAVLDSTLYQIKRFDHTSHIGTHDHGSVISVGDKYYSHGLKRFNFKDGNRNLVFHRYDTNFAIVHADTLGLIGKDNYPFFKKSLDYRNDRLMIGAHLDGPFNQPNTFTHVKKFYLAKYDLDMNQIWYKEYGGDKAYWIAGLHMLDNGGCLLYGFITDTIDEKRYAYLMYVDENGDIISSTTMPPKMASSIQIVNPGNDHFEMLNPEAIAGTLRLYDLQGRLLQQEDFYQEKVSIPTTFLPAGSYAYTITSKSTHVISGTWVKAIR